MARVFLILGGNHYHRSQKAFHLYQEFKPQSNPQTDPDTTIVEPSGIKAISLETIKNLQSHLSLKPYQAPPKVAIIFEAEKLTFEAQNKLLKFLEEPPGETVIILTTSDKENLLTTIVSRCQQVNLPPEPEIKLEKEEFEESKQSCLTILKSSPGQRLQFAAKITDREAAMRFCQTQMIIWREILLENPNSVHTKVLREIQKSLNSLQANINVRLVIENLLLSYPQTTS